MRQVFSFGVIGLAVLFFCGCNTTRFMADSMVPVTKKMNMAVNRNTDLKLVENAIPAGIIQLEGLLEASPDNEQFLFQLAEAYNGYAFAFIEDEDPERAGRLYEKAYGYSLQVLNKNPQFAEAVDQPLPRFESALASFDKSDVPALFFAATSRLSWIGIHLDDPEVFLQLPKVKALADRIVELDESYYYGGGHALLGVYYASRSPVTGGDPGKARSHFDSAFAISEGRFLPYYLLFAEYYAYQVQDRDLYVQTLEGVLEKPADMLPERAFINAVARQKAAAMLNMTDELF